MVKQISEIGNGKNGLSVDEIFPQGNVSINVIHKRGHVEGCQCEVCELIGKDEKTCEFIKKARKVHGDKYGYAKTEYIKSRIKITITCPQHGEFKQTPNSHIVGRGCKKCGNIKRNNKNRLSQEVFIERSIKAHGSKYDYSKSKYICNYIEVKIICPIHGIFKQTPENHWMGKECRKCSRTKAGLSKTKSAASKFEINSLKIHGNKYNYSKVIYISSRKDVTIICLKHGEFEQTPNNHLSGFGCQKCGIEAISLNKEEFVKRSIIIHGNKYGYSKVEYVDIHDDVKIFCNKCDNFFTQTPSIHLKGSGCYDCGIKQAATKRKGNKEKFSKDGEKIHNNKYDYSLVNYIDTYTEVDIICSTHGVFRQKPVNHLRGSGCKKCGGNNIPTINEFVDNAQCIHGNKYDYSESEYVDAITQIKIICPIHGAFFKTPNSHLSGVGCRECSPKSRGEDKTYKSLKELKLRFKQWHRPPGCKHKNQLEFDFYVKKYNLCIEFDGKQHFVPFSFGSTTVDIKEAFEILQKCDGIKNKFCIDNKINLLRIHYKDFKNIKKLILSAIEKIKTSETGYVANLY